MADEQVRRAKFNEIENYQYIVDPSGKFNYIELYEISVGTHSSIALLIFNSFVCKEMHCSHFESVWVETSGLKRPQTKRFIYQARRGAECWVQYNQEHHCDTS